MLHHKISDSIPHGIAAGATLGARHLQRLLAELPRDLLASSTLLIDFEGLEGVTASYLKAFLIPLIAGSAVELEIPQRDAVRLCVFVVNLSEDTTDDLHAALRSAGKLCLEALDWDESGVHRARVLGRLEDKIEKAFARLLLLGSGTAADLRKQDRSVGVTGWHYRLGELQKLGLVRRTKHGRSWIYEPIVTEVIRG